VTFSPGGRLLAAACGDGYVRLWDPATDRPVGAPLMADPGPGGGVNGVAFSADGGLLASAEANGTVLLWQVWMFADPYAALCAAVGPPTKANWAQYAPDEPQPSVCS
jgi:WD40 repeat protein